MYLFVYWLNYGLVHFKQSHQITLCYIHMKEFFRVVYWFYFLVLKVFYLYFIFVWHAVFLVLTEMHQFASYFICDKMVWLFWLLIIFFSWINLHLLRFTTSQYCSLYFANTLACIHGSYQWFNKQREGGRCDACNPIAYQRQTNISPFISHPRPNRTAKIQVNAYWSTVLFLIYFVYKAPCFFFCFVFFI